MSYPANHVGHSVAPWFCKLFLTEDESDLRLRGSAPDQGPCTLTIVAVTGDGLQLLGSSVARRGEVLLSVPRSAVPEESREGSMENASLLEPTDVSKPGVYALLWSGDREMESLTQEQWNGMHQTGPLSAPVGASLVVETGASLLPDGGSWPVSSMGPDAYWLLSSSTPARLALVMIHPATVPPQADLVFLVRRGTRGMVVAPVWTLAPGAPALGYMDLGPLIGGTGSSVTVRRYRADETQSVNVTIQEHDASTPITQTLPPGFSIGGITYSVVEAQWRDDNTLKLQALE